MITGYMAKKIAFVPMYFMRYIAIWSDPYQV